MLPQSFVPGGQIPLSRGSSFPMFMRRLLKPNQMDYEFTLWLMVQLLISPKTAGIAYTEGMDAYRYRHTSYHKQTKNQWARDDPAFIMVTAVLLASAASAYCITFGHGFWNSVLTVLSAIFVDFLGIGVIFGSACWLLANRFLKKANMHHHTSEQSVEWLYALDVHCNSYIPMFALLYVVQLLISPMLLTRSFFSSVLASLLYVAAFSYYHYMNFLGYSALPFLEHTEVFLWPIPLFVLSLPFLILTGFNPSRYVLGLFFPMQVDL